MNERAPGFALLPIALFLLTRCATASGLEDSPENPNDLLSVAQTAKIQKLLKKSREEDQLPVRLVIAESESFRVQTRPEPAPTGDGPALAARVVILTRTGRVSIHLPEGSPIAPISESDYGVLQANVDADLRAGEYPAAVETILVHLNQLRWGLALRRHGPEPEMYGWKGKPGEEFEEDENGLESFFLPGLDGHLLFGFIQAVFCPR